MKREREGKLVEILLFVSLMGGALDLRVSVGLNQCIQNTIVHISYIESTSFQTHSSQEKKKKRLLKIPIFASHPVQRILCLQNDV
jgi:hypothetical protein